MAYNASLTNTFVFVEILQNGVPMTSTRWKISRRGTMYLSGGPGGELVLPHYAFPDNRLEFLTCSRGHCELTVDHRWEGFCTSKGQLIQIDRKNHGRHVLEMFKGDYASVARDDLRILVRIGAPKVKKEDVRRRGTLPAYRAAFFSNFISTAEEYRSLAAAVLITAVIIGGMLVGLGNRRNEKPQTLADLDKEYILPFIGEEQIKNAPEDLQNNLDRRNYLRSVIAHYFSYTNMLMGKSNINENQVLPTTLNDYQRSYADADAKIEEAIEKQKKLDESQLIKKGTGILAIPTVIGESSIGSMLRLVDKIAIKQTALEKNLAAKRGVIKDFPKDPGYDFEEYKNLTKIDEGAKEYLSKIRPWDRLTDEEVMYSDAKRLGKLASRRQNRLGMYSKSDALDPTDDTVIALESGAKFASFLSDIDFMDTDEKLYQLQASEWGIKPKSAKDVIREPLVGEIDPSIIERHIEKNRFQLQLCYELALRRNEGAQGVMEWKWRIDSRGVITDLALISSSIQDQRMVKCIRQKIAAWRFPRPRRGSVEISYPFEFAPTKG